MPLRMRGSVRARFTVWLRAEPGEHLFGEQGHLRVASTGRMESCRVGEAIVVVRIPEEVVGQAGSRFEGDGQP